MDRPVSDPTLPPSEIGSSLSQQILKHLYNLEVAACFINWLIRGNTDFPSQTKDLFERLECDVLNAGVSDTFPVDYLRVAHDKWTTDKDSFPDVTKLRQPLFLALAVSPLILVSDITTTTNNLSRIQLLRAWFHYGNQRPPILAKVEYAFMARIVVNGSRSKDVERGVEGICG
ncbi:hypothetical protein MPER_07433 [Moniliophthora perniciosa FA553]|nr:hypothetical protein MPER_07433 [Moniliophthora perniciosa FA553]